MNDKEKLTTAEKTGPHSDVSEMISTARKLCHELNQPMQAISGYADLLAMGVPKDDPNYAKIVKIQDAVVQVNEITGKLMQLIRHPDGASHKSRSG